jgi:hypothetical protein
MSSPIAFIIGAGTGVGRAVALKLKAEGYKVAVGSRNPDKAFAEKNGLLPVTLDVLNVATIEAGFKSVRDAYGAAPNVVVFNAASHVPLPVPGEALSLDVVNIQGGSDIGVGLFAAAKYALSGFRDLSKSGNTHPKVFIYTGNALPFFPVASPPWNGFTILGLQKRTGAYFLEAFAATHAPEGFRFRYADQNSADGKLAGAEFSAEAHATAYWNLIQGKEEGTSWYYRFGKDGQQLPPRE